MRCSECDAELAIPSDVIQGEVVSCKECSATYELIREQNAGLFTLRPAEIEGEDWGE